MPRPDPAPLAAALLERAPDGLYAIVDTARRDAIHPGLERAAEKACLYAGELPGVLARAAPWLVRCLPGEDFLPWMLRAGWGDSWGIFVAAEAGLEELRKHFRRFLEVESDRGKKLYFRYYDPRVLRSYLPTCTADELAFVFGPVAAYLLESEDGSALLDWRRGEEGLAGEELGFAV